MIELQPSQFDRALHLFNKDMPNYVFIISTIEGRSSGKVYVDDIDKPTISVLKANYRNTTFIGGKTNQEYISQIIADLRKNDSFRIVWTSNLENINLSSLDAQVVERLEFFNCSYETETPPPIPDEYQLKQVNADLLENCEWQNEILLTYGSVDNFLKNGIGLCLVSNSTICNEAYVFLLELVNLKLAQSQIKTIVVKG